jgi:hypothetical protein
LCSFPVFRNELIGSQPLSVFFAELPSFAKPMCGKQFAGLNCAVKRKLGFQSLEARSGSVSASRNKCKMLEGNMPSKFDVIAIGTGSGASAVASRCREAGWQVAIVDSRPSSTVVTNRHSKELKCACANRPLDSASNSCPSETRRITTSSSGARFWIVSGLPTNRELLHSWTQARLPGLIVVCFGRFWSVVSRSQMRGTWGTHFSGRTHFHGT